ncbi:hypothetical protein [Nonomuraea sp. NPDC049504]|uniref:hypothetical protein n=1 Tax=Nonomuraea sp. NPDC049504 TaxID=3154729 RepID=UPI00343F8E43
MTLATTAARRRMVSPAHARALANYGPGWAIMWDESHAQPVIVRAERGDDGRLLEICAYEDMFTLGGDCDPGEDASTCPACTPGAPPDFYMIAAHMTDILGDYYHDRADIAAYMPLALPYTRALVEYGYQRRFQGNRHYGNGQHDTFHQLYRSPDHHLVQLIITLSPADAPTEAATTAPPLTIEWTYLGHTGPDGTYPVTDVPADTPPADVAELIAAHIALHPPTATAPDSANTPEITGTPATT